MPLNSSDGDSARLGLVTLGLAVWILVPDPGVDALGWQHLVLNNQLLTRQLMGRNSQDPQTYCNF